MSDEKKTCGCCCKGRIRHYVIQFFITLAAVITAILIMAFISNLIQRHQMEMLSQNMPAAAQPGMPMDADSKLAPPGGGE